MKRSTRKQQQKRFTAIKDIVKTTRYFRIFFFTQKVFFGRVCQIEMLKKLKRNAGFLKSRFKKRNMSYNGAGLKLPKWWITNQNAQQTNKETNTFFKTQSTTTAFTTR